MGNQFKDLAAKYKDEIVRTASELVQINSQSLHEKEIAAYISKKMDSLGYEVTVDKYGNVFGTLKGTGGGSSVTLNCHMDVVESGDESRWRYPPYSGTIAEGRIWGRGASDTKGTMAIQLYVPAILRDAGLLPKGDIVVGCVIAEENAGFGAMVHTQEGRMLTDYAVLGEASENDIAIGSRGRCGPYITITGKSCHASVPQEGCNPFEYLKILLPELDKVEMSRDELFGSSNMSLTKIESSEKGTNIIPNELVLYMDYRETGDDDVNNVRRKLQEVVDRCHVPGITAKVDIFYFPLTTYTGETGMGFQGEEPFSVRADEPYIVRAKAAVEEAVGREIKTKPWPFATDAGHYASKGVKVLGYSPAEVKLCHTVEDSISIEMMEEGIAGYLALTLTLANESK